MTTSKDNFGIDTNTQLITISADGIIKDSNNNLFKLLEGDSIYDSYPFFEIIRNVISEEHSVSQEVSFPCIHFGEDTSHRICDVTVKILKNEIDIVLFDYTKKYKELNKLSQQKNESVLKSQRLQLENDFLLKKEEFKNNFIANINHEIRTPLTAIMGFVGILDSTQLNFEQEELSRIIKRETSHLKKMIDDMLSISKIEAGQLSLEWERFDFESLTNGFQSAYSLKAREKGIKFECYSDPNIPKHLLGDKTRLYQILDNLLNNAFKFTEEGKISLLITKNYDRSNKISLNFKIIDTGIGIPEDTKDAIFDRFVRLQKDSSYSGTGLGLSIVKSLVEAMSGDIKVTSNSGEGTTFTVNLHLGLEIRAKKKEGVEFPQYPILNGKQKFRILLAENKEIMQYLIMKILINHGNFYIDVAMNGEQAITYVEQRKYDLILMDLKMPVMNGYDATKAIRKNYGDKEISEIPIIGITGKTDDDEQQKCLDIGMSDFIQKPFTQEELLSKIGHLLTKKAAS